MAAKTDTQSMDKHGGAGTPKRSSGLRRRVALAAAPAAMVTAGLLMAMQGWITVDMPEPTAKAHPPLEQITPSIEDPSPERTERSPVRQIAVTPPPAMSPLQAPARGDVVIGSVPLKADWSVRPGKISVIPAAVTGALDRTQAEPIVPPMPVYPRTDRAVEGACEVVFSVNTTGEPFGIAADCTDRIFVRPAQRAVARALFAPRLVDGVPVEQHNVVYPIVFELAED